MKVTVSFLDNLEESIRLNRAPGLKRLAAIRSKDIPRPLAYRYANLLRRMGGVKSALAVLNPIVRKKTGHPNHNEIIEYAACLTRLSLVDESIGLLSSIKNDPSPEIYFELAMANVSKWEYETARTYFDKYLHSSSITEYKRCVGKLNLGACYIYTDEISEASKILRNVLVKAKAEKFRLLCGNILELLGEIAILQKNYFGAEKCLTEANLFLGSTNTRYLLYLKKWRAISRLLQEKGSTALIKDLTSLRAEAAKLRDWNNIREIELFMAIATDDLQKVTDLYYSVPYPVYRKRILRLWGKAFSVSEIYEKKIGRRPLKTGNVFDVAAGKDLKSGCQLKVGQAPHRLVQCLSSDFYAPFSTTRIFSSVFKNTFFNPETSPQQVYEIIKRLNTWFLENNLDLRVLRGEGGYRLRSEEGYILRIPEKPVSSPTRLEVFLESLWKNNLTENFSVSMVEQKLGLPRRSVTRYLGEATAEGFLVQTGGGHATRYSRSKK